MKRWREQEDGGEGRGERGERGRDLERQQALVDLCSFQACLTVSAGCVRSPLVARQVDERELSVHLPPPPENDLEDGVAPRGVSVGRRLP